MNRPTEAARGEAEQSPLDIATAALNRIASKQASQPHDEAFAALSRIRSPRPSPSEAGGVDAVAVNPTVEQIARAICRGKDLNPDCQNQGAARDGSVDGHWDINSPFGRPYDNRWHYGWRNQAKAAESVLDLLASLSPAATPEPAIALGRTP